MRVCHGCFDILVNLIQGYSPCGLSIILLTLQREEHSRHRNVSQEWGERIMSATYKQGIGCGGTWIDSGSMAILAFYFICNHLELIPTHTVCMWEDRFKCAKQNINQFVLKVIRMWTSQVMGFDLSRQLLLSATDLE